MPTNHCGLSKISLAESLVHELHNSSPLRRSSVPLTTFRDYSANVKSLLTYISALQLPSNTPLELDKAVSRYGVYLYDLNPRRGSLQSYRCTLFGIIFFMPELKSFLGRSRQPEKGWDKIVRSKSPSPLSLTTVNAIPVWFASCGKIRASLAVNLGLHCFVRANEICNLKISDLCFPNDVRLPDYLTSRSGCVVRSAKTGKNRFIRLSDDTLLRRLHRFIASKPLSAVSLFSLSYAELSASFKTTLHHLHLSNHGYQLHSIWHGGAAYEWLNSTPLQDVMMKGRWKAEASCKRYLNAGKALLVRTSLSRRSVSLISHYAPRLCASASEGRVEWTRATTSTPV